MVLSFLWSGIGSSLIDSGVAKFICCCRYMYSSGLFVCLYVLVQNTASTEGYQNGDNDTDVQYDVRLGLVRIEPRRGLPHEALLHRVGDSVF